MTKKNRSNRSTRGFTVLEILIAVLIVGIIATAAVPLVSDYAERARDAQIEANTKAVEMASQRYELVHKVPLGYAVDTSTDTLHDIFGDDGSGFWMQLVNPTDANGNILGASLDPTANAFAYGPYLAPGSAKPASLLLGARAVVVNEAFGGRVNLGTTPIAVGFPTNLAFRATYYITLHAGEVPFRFETFLADDVDSPSHILEANRPNGSKVDIVEALIQAMGTKHLYVGCVPLRMTVDVEDRPHVGKLGTPFYFSTRPMLQAYAEEVKKGGGKIRPDAPRKMIETDTHIASILESHARIARMLVLPEPVRQVALDHVHVALGLRHYGGGFRITSLPVVFPYLWKKEA